MAIDTRGKCDNWTLRHCPSAITSTVRIISLNYAKSKVARKQSYSPLSVVWLDVKYVASQVTCFKHGAHRSCKVRDHHNFLVVYKGQLPIRFEDVLCISAIRFIVSLYIGKRCWKISCISGCIHCNSIFMSDPYLQSNWTIMQRWGNYTLTWELSPMDWGIDGLFWLENEDAI